MQYRHFRHLPLLFVCALFSQVCSGASFDSDEDEDENSEPDSPFSIEFDLDIETSWEKRGLAGLADVSENISPVATLNLKPELVLNDWSRIFLEYEVESEGDDHDEIRQFFVEAEWSSGAVRLGRQTLPISQSEGEFINDNFFEFAETNKTALLGTYTLDNGLGVTAYAFDSEVDTGQDSHELDAGAAVSFGSMEGPFFAQIGYLSDLSESEEPLVDIEDFNGIPRAPALSAQLYATRENWRFMLEHIESVDELVGAEPGFERPAATSLEAFIKSESRWLVGGRFQLSRELEDAPEQEYGITSRFWMTEALSFGLEYVYGRFNQGQTDEEGNEIQDNQTISIELTLEL